ncbi:MAG TPA: GrpB family protein [Gemmatimonadaceae bacterium]|nr:GrpB family protein [Gemmatimonadaceae bacterium]
MDPLGLPSGAVVVVPYDDRWPGLYAAEAARIADALAARRLTLRLEHTGSTAVPGLAAKPVLDILVGRGADADRDAIIAALEDAGYEYRGEQGIAGRDFFRRGRPRQYHVHLAAVDSAFWNDHRRFRDYLRANPETARAYAQLKFALARLHPLDREAYIAGKTNFVRDVLARARAVDGMRRPAHLGAVSIYMGVAELHVRVTGRVQGVGFRWFVREHAHRLGLDGWVRNTVDGSVEVLAVGPDAQIDALRRELQRGPRGADVIAVELVSSTAEEEPTRPFAILR